MNRLDWSLFRSFLAVIEHGSLSKAAKAISATQPTLSRHIRELEAELGVTLFTRSAQGLDPTAAALGLVDDARAMGAAAEALDLKARGRSQQLSGTVRVTASVIVGTLILPPILVALRHAEPNIQIELVTTDTNQNLLRRDADIAIRMAEPTQNALIARKLGETPMGLFGTKSYFDRRGRVTSIADLHRHDLIGLDRGDALIRGMAAYGVTVSRDDFVQRSDDHMVGWHLLLAGGGIGIAQVLLANRHDALEQVDLGVPFRPLPVWLVMSEEVRGNARVRRVADCLADALIDVLRH